MKIEQPQLATTIPSPPPTRLLFPLPTEWTRTVTLKHDVTSQPDIPLDYHSTQSAPQPINQSVNQLDIICAIYLSMRISKVVI